MIAFTSTILITGGTTGLGYWAAYELGLHYPTAKIIIASRTDNDNASDSLNKLLQGANKSESTSESKRVEWMSLDLVSKANVRKFVTALAKKSYPSISHLMLNAGL